MPVPRISTCEELRRLNADLRAAHLSWPRAIVRLVALNPFWLIAAYRCAHWLRARSVPILPSLLHGWSLALWGADISSDAHFGGGLHIPHPVGVVVGEHVACGDDTTLYQGVTLGGRGPSHREYAWNSPTVGNRVTVGAGACILGPVRIGDDVWIGANAVTLSDVPTGATVVGYDRIIKPSE